jgi:hypothetical protein
VTLSSGRLGTRTSSPTRAAAQSNQSLRWARLAGVADDGVGRWSAGPGREDASEPDGATATLVRQTRPPAAAGHQFGHAVRPRPSLSVSDAPGLACVASPPPPSFSSCTDSPPPIPSLTARVASVEALFNRKKSPKGKRHDFPFDFLRPARLLAYTDCELVLVAEPRPGRAPPPPTPPGRSRVQKGGPARPRPSGLPIDSEFRAGIW